MTPFLRKILGMNWVIVALSITLCVLGVIAVYSATWFSGQNGQEYWHKQITWVAAGLAVFFVVSLIHYSWVKWAALPLYLAGIALVMLTYTSLGQEHGGAKCWLRLPGIGTFQPSQLALVAAILTLGLFLSQFRRLHPFLKLVFTGAIVG